MIKQNRHDPYWLQVANQMKQFEGLVDGYNSANPTLPLTTMQLLLVQASGDLYDIIPAVVPSERLDFSKMNTSVFDETFMMRSSCSALIRVIDGGMDIAAGHNTWTDFGSMVRTYKIMNFQYRVPGAQRISFSSKPGLLYSKDDFYATDAGMIVMETTNGILDEAVFKRIKPEALLTWQRIPVVNRLATNGSEWTATMDRHSSGTYANQWMVLDLNVWAKAQKVTNDLLWIIEQLPGYSRRGDVSSVLAANGGYWPSFNVPYFPDVYNMSGFYDAYLKHGDQYSYTKAPRAQIFKRDAPKVTNLESFKRLLRYNDWKNDPLSLNEPRNAISSRYDLRPTNPTAFGSIDGKVSSYLLAMGKDLMVEAQSSPTHDKQPVFDYATTLAPEIPHWGEPSRWDFGWYSMF